MPRVQLGAR